MIKDKSKIYNIMCLAKTFNDFKSRDYIFCLYVLYNFRRTILN